MPCKTSRRWKSNRHIRPTAKSNNIGTIGSILRRRPPNRRRHDYTTAVKIQKTSSRYYHRQYQRGSFLMQNYRLLLPLHSLSLNKNLISFESNPINFATAEIFSKFTSLDLFVSIYTLSPSE